MAIGTYELWLDHWNGTRLAYLDSFLNLEYTRALHNVGVVNLTMPSSFDPAQVGRDYKLEVWRALPGVPKRLENVYLLRAFRKWTDEAGVAKTMLMGVDGNDILKRRIVWAQPSSTQARKTDNAGDLIKQYMREALAESVCYGATSSPTRGNVAPYFTVQADNGQGASFTKNYAGRTLFDAANGIASTSTGRGTPIWWYVYPVSGSEYQLRTYLNLFGQDLTGSVTISPDYAMAGGLHEFDGVDEFNMVLGAGGLIGLGTYPEYRKMEYAYNQASYQLSPFAWREKFLDVGSEPDNQQIIDTCYDEVSADENIPQEAFSCTLEEWENFRYGRDWDLGDKVGVSYRGLQMEAVIRTVYVNVGNTEKVQVIFRIEQPSDVQTS